MERYGHTFSQYKCLNFRLLGVLFGRSKSFQSLVNLLIFKQLILANRTAFWNGTVPQNGTIGTMQQTVNQGFTKCVERLWYGLNLLYHSANQRVIYAPTKKNRTTIQKNFFTSSNTLTEMKKPTVEYSLSKVNADGQLQTFENGKWNNVTGYWARDKTIEHLLKVYDGKLDKAENISSFIYIEKQPS